MQIDFWFDPACPFCWVTSRWIEEIKSSRDLDINWRAISLYYKNNMAEHPDNEFYEPTKKTLRMLRVVMAVKADGQAEKIGALYTEFGRRIHNRHELDFEIAPILTALDIDPSLAAAADHDTWDVEILADMDAYVALVGNDVGTPVIALDGSAGRVGLFGPVITELPDAKHATALWDGFIAMADTPGFFELKRGRTDHPHIPDESRLPPSPA
ncbi:MAG: DsbA family protein [Actinobacteria bacterium]|nr:DsbA family protein [Actinomycetota bacterium]MCB9390855.1 DsbA family protein [Acidimicrobiia bacterium]